MSRETPHTARRWRVRVNETRLLTYSQRDACQWWCWFRRARTGISMVAPGVIGDVVEIACDDGEHALWLADHMLAQGIPAAALKVISDARADGGAAGRVRGGRHRHPGVDANRPLRTATPLFELGGAR